METLGLWAVLIGALLEGEAAFIAAGYAVSQGYLPLAPTLAVATLGASLGDHFFFLVGRRWGGRVFRGVPRLRPLRARAALLLRRWGRAASFAARFAYGLRAVVPLSMGASRYPLLLFFPFNLLGAVAFATLYLSLGYFFGEAVEDVLGRVRGSEHWILLGIIGVGALTWAAWEWRLFHPKQPPDGPDEPPAADR